MSSRTNAQVSVPVLALLFLTDLLSTVPQALESKDEAEHLPTVDALIAQRKQRLAQYQEQDTTASSTAITIAPPKRLEEETPVVAGSPEELEEEADQQGAFNPETGEINWDCPCLGGMAHGPCGEEFKAAFSCFVYSKEEPKGVDCIEKFKYIFSFNSWL